MPKTLSDLAEYLTIIILPEPTEAFPINPVFAAIAEEETIREGVGGFRAFLIRLCSVLAAQGGSFDNHKKAAHAFENRTTISVYYPFLHHVKNLLIKMGYEGTLAENAQSLTCGNGIFDPKLSAAKTMECLRFLTDCGLAIDGICWNGKKQSLETVKTLNITCPGDPRVLTGLKVMATAEIVLGSLANQDIFLRCDYRALGHGEPDAVLRVEDTVHSLPDGVRSFVMGLHQRYLEKGLRCDVEIKGFWIYVKYSWKRKLLWGLNASLNNGFEINVKAENTRKYSDLIETFPLPFQEMIVRGYGCGKKRGISDHCDGGCRGLRIPLDDSVLGLRDVIETWFDRELSCLQGK